MPDKESGLYQSVYQKPTLSHIGGLSDLTSGGSGGKRESKSSSSKSKSSSSKKKKRYGMADDDNGANMLHAGLFIPTVHAKSKSKRP